MLPRVKINYLNGQLGTISESEDGLFAIMGCSDNGWPKSMYVRTVYSIRSVDDYMRLASGDESQLYYTIEQFYNEAPAGTEVILYKSDKETSDFYTGLEQSIKEIMQATQCRLRGVFIESGVPVETKEEFEAQFKAAQAAADMCASELYSPIFIVLTANTNGVQGTESVYNRVVALAGQDDNIYTILGTLAGRLAVIPVHRNVGRVKDGPLNVGNLYVDIVEMPVTVGEPLLNLFYEAHCVVPRQYVGLSGYYFADDPMKVESTDDYAHLTARRTVDKAYRIAYQTLVQFMLDEIEVNEDGTMQNGVLKSWQQAVENAINRQMTAKGELSATDGEGCVCFIDPTQNVLATSRIELTLKVRPYGYARFIDVNLGFQVTA